MPKVGAKKTPPSTYTHVNNEFYTCKFLLSKCESLIHMFNFDRCEKYNQNVEECFRITNSLLLKHLSLYDDKRESFLNKKVLRKAEAHKRMLDGAVIRDQIELRTDLIRMNIKKDILHEHAIRAKTDQV